MKTIKNLSDTVKPENSSNNNSIMTWEEFKKIMEDKLENPIEEYYSTSQQYHICYRPYQ